MTALQTIIKEAKSIKKAYPNRFAKWTDYVKQASAIYASKHKGKSPVGKKKAVKKTAKKKLVKKKLTIKKISGSQDYYTRKKEGRVIPRKSTKKIVKKKSVKKPSEKDVLKSIQKSEKMQKSHMSGIDNKQKAMNTLMLMEKDLFDAIKFREDYKNTPIVKGSNNYYEFKNITQKRYFINKKNSEIKARKKAISEQYKLLKSIN
jgi:hypothetical protein